MTEADAKDRDASEELLNIFDSVADGLGVAGAIREEDTVWLEVENVFSGSLGGDDPNVAMVIDEQPQNILLDAEIVGCDTEFTRIGNSPGFAHGL